MLITSSPRSTEISVGLTVLRQGILDGAVLSDTESSVIDETP